MLKISLSYLPYPLGLNSLLGCSGSFGGILSTAKTKLMSLGLFVFVFFYKKKTPVVFPMYEILSAVFCIFLFFFIFIFLTNCMESCQ